MAKQEIQKLTTVLLCPIHVAGMSLALLQQLVKPVRRQTSAESALELHCRELEPNQPMNVFISNPERKKERTDEDANEREVYVAGLSKFTTQVDLDKLFKAVCLSFNIFLYGFLLYRQYGSVKEIRMATDRDGNAKGFAFVEFMAEVNFYRSFVYHTLTG